MESGFCGGFTVTVVGLGLIGGSMALSGRGFRSCRMQGVNRSRATIEQALQKGAIEVGASMQEEPEGVRKLLSESDLTVLCLYPEQTLAFLKEYGGAIRPGSVVTDACGVKGAIVSGARELLPQADFVGGHPMAGREVSGFSAAQDDLFLGCNYVLTPMEWNKPESLDLLREWARYLGARKITETTPEHHDRMIAYTSQMAHVLAASVANMKELFESRGFEGGSFRDITRVATLNDGMWSELFSLNAPALTGILDELIENLSGLRQEIAKQDREQIAKILRSSTQRKEEWNNGKVESGSGKRQL